MMKLSVQHQGRELLHGIALLLQCLRIPIRTEEERRRWWRDLRQSRADLGALYAAGLPRDSRRKPVVSGSARADAAASSKSQYVEV